MEAEVTGKCAMSLEQNAKGTWQGKISVETSTVESSKKMLSDAIVALKQAAKENGLLMTGEAY